MIQQMHLLQHIKTYMVEDIATSQKPYILQQPLIQISVQKSLSKPKNILVDPIDGEEETDIQLKESEKQILILIVLV